MLHGAPWSVSVDSCCLRRECTTLAQHDPHPPRELGTHLNLQGLLRGVGLQALTSLPRESGLLAPLQKMELQKRNTEAEHSSGKWGWAEREGGKRERDRQTEAGRGERGRGRRGREEVEERERFFWRVEFKRTN